MADGKKSWVFSKTIWGAIFVFVGGGLVVVGYEQLGQSLLALGAGLGFIGLRTAKEPLS